MAESATTVRVGMLIVNVSCGPFYFYNPACRRGVLPSEMMAGARSLGFDRIIDVARGSIDELLIASGTAWGSDSVTVHPPPSGSDLGPGVCRDQETWAFVADVIKVGQKDLECERITCWRIIDPLLPWLYQRGVESQLSGDVQYVAGDEFHLLGSHFEQPPKFIVPDLPPGKEVPEVFRPMEHFIRAKPTFKAGDVVGTWTRQPELPKKGYLGLQWSDGEGDEAVIMQLVFASREDFGEFHPAKNIRLDLGFAQRHVKYTATFEPPNSAAPLQPAE